MALSSTRLPTQYDLIGKKQRRMVSPSAAVFDAAR
jgi:hypothetical protein